MRGAFILLMLSIVATGMAQRRTVSGYVMDAESKETLIGATILDKVSGKGCATNSYGFYTLTLAQGPVELQVAFVGYDTQYHRFELLSDTTLSFPLQSNNQLDEVVVQASPVNAKTAQMSMVQLPVQQIKTIPTLFGEADVLKAIQLLPGVQNGTEGSAGMYVRGGGPDENLILLDGVPVYNASHALGFFSVFNPDAIKNVTLYKGSFPAHFGGRLSSVLDIRMKEGDMQQTHGNASIGIISSKVNVEGPIVKDKLSYSLSARRTYSDLIVRAALLLGSMGLGPEDNIDFGYNFYDINGKLNWKISDKDRLYLSAYTGDDNLHYKIRIHLSEDDVPELKAYNKFSWRWGNTVTALRWNHVVSNRLFMDASVNYTQYRHRLGFDLETRLKEQGSSLEESTLVKMGYKSGIHDVTSKFDFYYTPIPNHEMRFGGNYTYHIFRPDVQTVYYGGTYITEADTVMGAPVIHAHETGLYFEDNMTLGDIFRINLGAHYSTFTVQGKTHQSLQPRVSLSVMLAPNLSVKAGYADMSQYVHLLSNSSLSLPTDLWVPVTASIQPMKARQASLGAFYEVPEMFDVSVEGYYKTMDNLLEYREGSSFLGSSETWDQKVSMGRGWAYGIELLLQRSFGKTTGWIGYTWAHSNRLFDREGQVINEGNVFPAKYDRRHDFSITVQHKLNNEFDFSGTWVFSSGNCGTLGIVKYYNGSWEGFPIELSDFERNNYRLPNYHRLDLSMNYHFAIEEGSGTVNLSVYNVYNRKNPFIVYSDYDYEMENPVKKFYQLSLFPIIPSLSFSYKF